MPNEGQRKKLCRAYYIRMKPFFSLYRTLQHQHAEQVFKNHLWNRFTTSENTWKGFCAVENQIVKAFLLCIQCAVCLCVLWLLFVKYSSLSAPHHIFPSYIVFSLSLSRPHFFSLWLALFRSLARTFTRFLSFSSVRCYFIATSDLTLNEFLKAFSSDLYQSDYFAEWICNAF